MVASPLFAPLHLPNGTVIPNRIAKAAMEENLADDHHAPSEPLIRLYRTWAEGGAGLIITGNVMIDHRALTGPGGVVLEGAEHLPQFRRWAAACRSNGAQAWLQINHPGRQLMAGMGQPAMGPSAIAVAIPGISGLFAQPRAMSAADIENVIERFVHTAVLAEQAGFSGVQIHAAHGYLFSQFLSPLSNQRDDDWGGSLDNRARILLTTLQRVRARVSADFCVAVKLNSADFQRGGFEFMDALRVVERLNQLPIDLLEITGGSYESPAMQGRASAGQTLAREAYFLEFAEQIGALAKMPVMVTGGIRRKRVAERVLRGSVAMLGMATSLSIDPWLPKKWQAGVDAEVVLPRVEWKNQAIAAVAQQAVIKKQLSLLSEGRPSNPRISPLLALLLHQIKTKRMTKRYRNWVATLGAKQC